MFISNYEKQQLQMRINSLQIEVSRLIAEVDELKAISAVYQKKVVDLKKEEAAKLRRREYARTYAQRKKQEKLKAKFDALISSAPVVTMSS